MTFDSHRQHFPLVIKPLQFHILLKTIDALALDRYGSKKI